MVDPFLLLTFALPALTCAAGVVYFLLHRQSSVFYEDTFAFIEIMAVGLIMVASTVGAWAALTDNGSVVLMALASSSVGYAVVVAAGPVWIARVASREREYAREKEAAKAQREHLDAILHASELAGVAVVMVGAGSAGEDTVIRCSPGGARLLDRRIDEVVGRSMSSLIREDDRDVMGQLLKVAADPEEGGVAATVQLSVGGNRTVPVDVGLTRAGTQPPITAVFLVDARPRHSAEVAAKEARSDAEFYLDLVTHDLSNFNQGALGYLELIELSTEAPRERLDRFHHSALEQIQNCARLIENVKLLSIIRDSREPLTPVDAVRALHDAMQRVVVSWTKKHVEMRLVPTTTETKVLADAWLEYLFYHILDNAAKFTPGERVEVATSVAASPDRRSLIFRISDRGRGIPPPDRAAILDRISSRRRDYAAYRSGVGLFIVKTVADRYGAKLWIEDRVPGDPSMGSVFCVELPAP